MMIEYWDLNQHKIRLKILQFFSILILFDSRYAKPYTVQYAACNFMMLTFFSKSEVHFGSKLLSCKLILLSVKLIAMFWSPLTVQDQALTEQQIYWTIRKQCYEKNVVAIVFFKKCSPLWRYRMTSRRRVR